jgi:hypothetical protein
MRGAIPTRTLAYCYYSMILYYSKSCYYSIIYYCYYSMILYYGLIQLCVIRW